MSILNSARAARLLSQHREDLETMIAQNADAHVTPVYRRALDAKDEEARTWLARIEREARFPSEGFTGSTLGMFGENCHAPALRDICRQAERFRTLGRIGVAA